MRIFVLANTPEEFADWCVRNHVNPLGVTCVLHPGDIRGKIKTGDRLIDARPPTPVLCSTAREAQPAPRYS